MPKQLVRRARHARSVRSIRSARSAAAIAAAACSLIGSARDASGINVVLSYVGSAANEPTFDAGGAGLTSIMNHVRTTYNDVFEDTHTVTISYRWGDLSGTNLSSHALNAQAGGRETAGTIIFDTRLNTGGAERIWFIDPTPAQNEE